jgi:hypothetical protein
MPPDGSTLGRAVMCTMTPEPRCRMCGATARLSHSAGPRLTSTMRRSVSGVVLSASPGRNAPMVLTSTSGPRPWRRFGRRASPPQRGRWGRPPRGGGGGIRSCRGLCSWAAVVCGCYRSCMPSREWSPSPRSPRAPPPQSPVPLPGAARKRAPRTHSANQGSCPGSAFHGSSTTKSCDRSGRSGFRESCGSAVVPRSASVTETQNAAASSRHHRRPRGWAGRSGRSGERMSPGLLPGSGPAG